MTTAHAIQWKRLFVEAIAIVASILLAFSIDAWWEERSDRIRLAGAIQNNAAEIRDAREEIENAAGRNAHRIDGVRRFLALHPDELLELPEETLLFFRDVFYTPSPFDSSGYALQGLLAGGNLEIPDAVEVRSALLSLRRDRPAMEVLAQYLFYFEDFNRQLSAGTEYADRVLNASQQLGEK